MSVLLRAALRYAALGVPVLPLHTPRRTGCSCGHLDCGSPGKHPRSHPSLITQGLHEASTDLDRIQRWWNRWPAANIGLRTGEVVDVCDIDSVEGLQALRGLLDGSPIPGPIVRTGSGGWHLYVLATGRGNRVKILPGVDWRGKDGYVVAPPSLHASGRRYEWHRRLGAVRLSECPEALAELLDPPRVPIGAPAAPIHDLNRYALAVISAEVERILTAPVPRGTGRNRTSGGRNHALNKAAYNLGRLVAGGVLAERQVVDALTDAARRVRLGQLETDRTIRSGLTAGKRRPRVADTGDAA